ncbi:MAG: zinc ribbon domain-containing protein [Acidobacteriota bacterium]
MSYDYSSEGKQLELPNPYRVQNQLLGLCAVLLIGGALFCLWKGRESWLANQAMTGLVPVVIGVGLLLAGLTAASAVASRLRFFFGRGRPASLSFMTANGQASVVRELPTGSEGTGVDAEHIKDMLKQGVLAYPEPQGPLNGLLYHWVPHLITAPMRLQELARTHFFNLGALLITLLSFGVADGLVRQPNQRPWLSLIYFGFAAAYLFRPLLSNRSASLNVQSVVGLVAGALLGPVAIGLLGPALPSLDGLSLTTQTLVLLITGLIAAVLVVQAILHQVESPPRTQTSSVQRRLSLNCPPNQLMDELDRLLQEQWTEKIPNRRYIRVEPRIPFDQTTGSFQGETIEESQPMPVKSSAAPSIAAAWASARHRWITALDLYATALVVIALILVLYFVVHFDGRLAAINHYSSAGTATILILVAVFCQRTAHELWGRFDFESVMQWVEVSGTYQTGKVGTGHNVLTSRLQTENHVTRVEAMTLRVWRARVESVAFGKDAPRQVTALFSTEAEAQNLADHLAEFGRAQSVLLAPTSAEDHARLSALGQAEGVLAQASPASTGQSGLPHTAALPALPVTPDEPAAFRFCPACGHKSAFQARFCSACGTPLNPH